MKKSKRCSRTHSKRRSKRRSKRYSKRYSKTRSKRRSKRCRKDGGLNQSRLYSEKEDIENIYKSKVTNFDDIINELYKDENISDKYRSKISIEKYLIEYIKENIRRPIKIRIYTLSGHITPIYDKIKNYLLYY